MGHNAATNASGIATATAFTANNQLGGYTVSAASAGLTTVNYSLSNITGPPASVLALTGTPQSAVISTVYATAFSAKVTDIAGNPLSGIFVTSILGVKPTGQSAYWGIYVNGKSASSGVCGIKLRAGQKLLFKIVK